MAPVALPPALEAALVALRPLAAVLCAACSLLWRYSDWLLLLLASPPLALCSVPLPQDSLQCAPLVLATFAYTLLALLAAAGSTWRPLRRVSGAALHALACGTAAEWVFLRTTHALPLTLLLLCYAELHQAPGSQGAAQRASVCALPGAARVLAAPRAKDALAGGGARVVPTSITPQLTSGLLQKFPLPPLPPQPPAPAEAGAPPEVLDPDAQLERSRELIYEDSDAQSSFHVRAAWQPSSVRPL